MSMRYALASVLTLNVAVSPLLTLMSVANPWMLGSPMLLTSHSSGGLPGLQFSATISLAGETHGSVLAAWRRGADARSCQATTAEGVRPNAAEARHVSVKITRRRAAIAGSFH